MTPAELVDGLTEIGPEDRIVLSALLFYLAKRAPDAVLSNGNRMCDIFDFESWLMDLARELRVNHG